MDDSAGWLSVLVHDEEDRPRTALYCPLHAARVPGFDTGEESAEEPRRPE
jgi:hypothetical protein